MDRDTDPVARDLGSGWVALEDPAAEPGGAVAPACPQAAGALDPACGNREVGRAAVVVQGQAPAAKVVEVEPAAEAELEVVAAVLGAVVVVLGLVAAERVAADLEVAAGQEPAAELAVVAAERVAEDLEVAAALRLQVREAPRLENG